MEYLFLFSFYTVTAMCNVENGECTPEIHLSKRVEKQHDAIKLNESGDEFKSLPNGKVLYKDGKEKTLAEFVSEQHNKN